MKVDAGFIKTVGCRMGGKDPPRERGSPLARKEYPQVVSTEEVLI